MATHGCDSGLDSDRAPAERLELVDAREWIEVVVMLVDAIEAQIVPLERELRGVARRRRGGRA